MGRITNLKYQEANLVQMRVAHLTMIQGIIGRMSVVSGTLKGFCVTMVAAVLALQPGSWSGRTALVGGLILIFALTDAAYLGMERDFRKLYDAVERRDMSEAHDLGIKRPRGFPSHYPAALRSWATMGFYLPLWGAALLLGVFVK